MKRILIFCFISWVYFSAYSQFNTITHSSRSSNTNYISPKIISDDSVRNVIDTIPIGYFPSISQIEKFNRYRQREFVSLPLDTCIVTSSFGKRSAPTKNASNNHNGVDLRCNGDYVYSILPGEVSKRGYAQKIGNYVEINHGDFRTIYGHLHSFLVKIHEAVEAGQPIAISGNTGNSTGPHLHFGVKYNKQYIDPQPILNYIQSFSETVRNEISQDIANELKKAK